MDAQNRTVLQQISEVVEKAKQELKQLEKQRDNLKSNDLTLRPQGAPNIDSPEISKLKAELSKKINGKENAVISEVAEIIGKAMPDDRAHAAAHALRCLTLAEIDVSNKNKKELKTPEKSDNGDKTIKSSFLKNEIKTSYGAAYRDSKFLNPERTPPKSRDNNKDKEGR